MPRTSSRPCLRSRFVLQDVIHALVVAGLFLPVSLAAQKADTLVLRNGSVIIGEVKRVSHGKLSYKTDDAGTLSVKWDKVQMLVTRNFYEIKMANGWKYFGSLDWPSEPRKIVVVFTSADTLDMDRVIAIERMQSGFWARTDGYVDLGFNLTRANQQTEWTLGFQGNYRGPKWGGRLTGSSYFRIQDDAASNTSRNSLGVAAQRFLKNKWSVLASITGEQNEEINLDLRTTTGGGAGYDLVRSNRMELLVISSLVGTNEKYSTSTEATVSLELLIGGDWKVFKFESPKLDLQTTLLVFTSLSDIGRVRTQWNLRVSHEVYSDFFVGLTGFVTYDSRPPTVDAVNFDYRANFTVGWSWN